MEMNLQPLATTCAVSGEPFTEGARVASYLVRSGAAMEIVRYDVLEAHLATFAPDGQIACRWVHAFKPRKAGENPDRALKLTAENLFVTLADPVTEPTPENTRLVQFLALMLERKRILKPRGRSADGARNRFEHAKTKQMFEIPAGELTPEFFVAVQEQLSVLVGVPKPKAGVAAAVGDSSAPGNAQAPKGSFPAETPAPAAAPVSPTETSPLPAGNETPSPEQDAAPAVLATEPASAVPPSSRGDDAESAPADSPHRSGGGTAAA